MKLSYLEQLLPGFILIVACSASATGSDSALVPGASPKPLDDPQLILIGTPPATEADGHQAWINEIGKARTSIKMTMFHLTDPNVIQALCDAAPNITPENSDPSDVEHGIHIILDRTFCEDSANAKILAKLKKCQIQVQPSSPTFSISHEKAMIIDNKISFITAMNMTKQESVTRDFGIITKNSDVIKEQKGVFAADWKNTNCLKAPTPGSNLSDSLVWSPTNSGAKLIALINSAKPGSTLDCSTESLTDTNIEDAFVDAAARGVKVQLLAPQCDENPVPSLNIDAMKSINERIQKVTKSKTPVLVAKVMPGQPPTGGGTADFPYIHSKMCLANYSAKMSDSDKTDAAFVGSVNLSGNSIQQARELGIIFRNKKAESQISTTFQSDFDKGIAPEVSPLCPTKAQTPGDQTKIDRTSFPICASTESSDGSSATQKSDRALRLQ